MCRTAASDGAVGAATAARLLARRGGPFDARARFGRSRSLRAARLRQAARGATVAVPASASAGAAGRSRRAARLVIGQRRLLRAQGGGVGAELRQRVHEVRGRRHPRGRRRRHAARGAGRTGAREAPATAAGRGGSHEREEPSQHRHRARPMRVVRLKPAGLDERGAAGASGFATCRQRSLASVARNGRRASGCGARTKTARHTATGCRLLWAAAAAASASPAGASVAAVSRARPPPLPSLRSSAQSPARPLRAAVRASWHP